MKNTIIQRYYNELKESGHTVPRNETTREVLPFGVGKEYDIICKEDKTPLRAICTQNCPYHLKLIPNVPTKIIDSRPAA